MYHFFEIILRVRYFNRQIFALWNTERENKSEITLKY